jgi:long-chain acyl-CoA synthetase
MSTTPSSVETAGRTGTSTSDGEILYLPRVLRHNAAEHGERTALRTKSFGIWQDITWSGYLEAAERIAFGLAALGVRAGDRVAIQSENRPEWLFTDLATAMLRAVIVGLYPTNPAAEIEFLLRDAGARVLVAEDQEQIDKAIAVVDACPDLDWVVYLDSRGVAGYDHPSLISIDELVRRGDLLRTEQPDLLERADAQRTPDDLVTLIYTSGTTGPPKGAMITAANLSFAARIFAHGEGLFGRPLGEDDVLLSYLPLSHVAERALSVWGQLVARPVTHFAESIDTVAADLAEVQPTVLFAVPRIWEKIQATVLIKSANASPLKRAVHELTSRWGTTIAADRLAHDGRHTPRSRVLYGLGWLLAYRALRRRLGLAKVRHAISGAAPIAPEVLTYFLGMGVPIHEAYGMTENSAIATANFAGRLRIGTVGEAQPGTELRIDEGTGEILTRHPGVFPGYWHRPEATAEVLDADGWLRTGDVGEWVDGTHLRIVDRIKDIIITAGGKNVSPSEIENQIKTSPFIKEVVVIGDRRPYLTALVGIEFDTVADWAARRKLPYTTYRDLSSRTEVIDLVAEVIRETNARLARVESVRKFRMIVKELDHEDGELTATQKLRRTAFAETVPHLIEDMYAGTDEFPGADLGRTG